MAITERTFSFVNTLRSFIVITASLGLDGFFRSAWDITLAFVVTL